MMRDEKPKTFSFNLDQRPDDDTGLVCGGSLQVFIEPVIPLPRIYIFGGGHIGLNVHKIATPIRSGFPMPMRFTLAIWMRSWQG